MTKIKKRDGRIVPFEREKIRRAILMAFKDVDGEITAESEKIALDTTNHIVNLCEDIISPIDVETIQDIVEEQLMESDRKDVAKRYILYREKRSKARERNTRLMKVINEKLSASNVQNQNANMDEYSFGGRKGEADAELMRKIALDYIVSDMARENHLNNEIYIHDLDSYVVGMHNCLSVPLDDLLANGFITRQTDVRPAQSINTAFQLVAVLFQIQSLQQFGGVSATHLDHTMVPYVKKSFYKHFKDGLKYIEDIEDPTGFSPDMSIVASPYMSHEKAYKYATDMTRKELYQAVQGMYHNLK